MPSRSRNSLKALPLLCLFSMACSTLIGGIGLLPRSTTTPPGSSPLAPTASATAAASLTPFPVQVYDMTQSARFPVATYGRIHFTTPTATLMYVLTEAQYLRLTSIASITAPACLLAYPDFCIKPLTKFTVRKTCDQLGRHNFTVLPPDPFNYDSDHNGIGCEQ